MNIRPPNRIELAFIRYESMVNRHIKRLEKTGNNVDNCQYLYFLGYDNLFRG